MAKNDFKMAKKHVKILFFRKKDRIGGWGTRPDVFFGNPPLLEENEGGKARRIFIDANNSMEQEAFKSKN